MFGFRLHEANQFHEKAVQSEERYRIRLTTSLQWEAILVLSEPSNEPQHVIHTRFSQIEQHHLLLGKKSRIGRQFQRAGNQLLKYLALENMRCPVSLF